MHKGEIMNINLNTNFLNNKIGFTCKDCYTNTIAKDNYNDAKSEMDLFIADLYDCASKNDISNEDFQKYLDFAYRERSHELGNLDILT